MSILLKNIKYTQVQISADGKHLVTLLRSQCGVPIWFSTVNKKNISHIEIWRKIQGYVE